MNPNKNRVNIANLPESEKKAYLLEISKSILHKKEIATKLGEDFTKYYMDKIVLEKNSAIATERLNSLISLSRQIATDKINAKLHKEYADFIAKIKMQLKETDWSQLPDAEIDRKKKEDYRKYRRYLRRLEELYKTKVIDKLEVLDFSAFKQSYLYNIIP